MTENQLKQQQLINYLTKAVRGQGAVDLSWAMPRASIGPYCMGASRPQAEVVANELLADAEFRAIQLGTWMNTPDGQLIGSVVSSLVPGVYRSEIRLLIRALQLAAALQRNAGKQRAEQVLVVAAVAALLIAIARL
jgi:hypothetical protein